MHAALPANDAYA